jgi:hypothetical protein
MRIVLAVALALLAGCGGSKVEFAELAYILADQRAACESRVTGVNSAWNAAIKDDTDITVAVAQYSTTLEGATLDARIQARREQAEPRLAALSDGSGEIRSALIDVAGKVASLCSAAVDPEGFSLMSFGEMRREASLHLDELESRTRILLGSTKVPNETKERLDAFVARSVEEATATLAEQERKRLATERAAEEQQAADELLQVQARTALREEEERLEAEKRREADEITAAQIVQVKQKQQRDAQELRTRQLAECESSKAWRLQYSQRFIGLGLQARAMSCPDLTRQAQALEFAMTTLPYGVQERAARLAQILRSLARGCSRKPPTNTIIAAKEAERLALGFQNFQNFCTENGLS